MTAAPLWTSAEAAAATGGRATPAWTATGVSIDSRTLAAGDLFVALAGPSFDGHDYVDAALARGAAAAMVSRADAASAPDAPLLVVDDTLGALHRLGAAGRARAAARVCAVTGSVGKTGTKEALRHVLAPQGQTAWSASSFNNHWGVPLSLARMPRTARFGVFEIGMNHPGEITPLSQLAQPHVAIVTTVAAAHTAHFDSLADIARAKAEIFAGMKGGTAVLNRDNEFFGLLADAARAAGVDEVIGFGADAAADLRLIDIAADETGSDVAAEYRGRRLEYRVGQPGRPWAVNSLAVLAAADALGADIDAAAAALADLGGLAGRGAIHVLRWGDGEIRVIDESYNANPQSMAAALETLGRMAPRGGRRLAVLGDMLELGDDSAAHHAALADLVLDNGVDAVWLAGAEIRALAEALPAERVAGTAATAAELLPMVAAGLLSGDVVTVKASRGIGLDRIVTALIDRAGRSRAANGN